MKEGGVSPEAVRMIGDLLNEQSLMHLALTEMIYIQSDVSDSTTYEREIPHIRMEHTELTSLTTCRRLKIVPCFQVPRSDRRVRSPDQRVPFCP